MKCKIASYRNDSFSIKDTFSFCVGNVDKQLLFSGIFGKTCEKIIMNYMAQIIL